MLAHTTLIAVLHGVGAGMAAIHLRRGTAAEVGMLHHRVVEALQVRGEDGMAILWI
jgi:hypothetical protein